MRGTVDDSRSGRHARLDQQVARHREEAEAASSVCDPGMRGRDHVAEAHRRDPPPAVPGRKETPVAEHVSGERVGDVVCGEREAVDSEQHLARPGIGGSVRVDEAVLVPVLLVHDEVETCRSCHIVTPAADGGFCADVEAVQMVRLGNVVIIGNVRVVSAYPPVSERLGGLATPAPWSQFPVDQVCWDAPED